MRARRLPPGTTWSAPRAVPLVVAVLLLAGCSAHTAANLRTPAVESPHRATGGDADTAAAPDTTVSPVTADTARTTILVVDPTDDLAARLVAAPAGTTLRLTPGEYHLTPSAYTDPTCGNCEEPAQPVAATLGLRLSGERMRLLGSGAGSTFIHTHAGYGILVEDCEQCVIDGVTITGGIRDPDGNATDAAIVVRRAGVAIRNCHIADNIGDAEVLASTVVGVIGIAGREGADITIADNRIRRNSWDGVALYRDATATIEGNLIDGVDRARGREAGGGRGVGIGVTWNARATVRGNLVRNYWKGIGAFVDARVVVEENIVEDLLTWGISLWDAGKGKPSATIRHNAIYRTGACGVSLVRDTGESPPPGELTGNALVQTGQNPNYDSGEPYCQQTAIARHAVPAEFRIAGNLLFTNREPGDRDGAADLRTSADFRAAAAPLLERLIAWPVLREAAFLRNFVANLPPPD